MKDRAFSFVNRHRCRTMFTLLAVDMYLVAELAHSASANGEPMAWQSRASLLILTLTVIFAIWFVRWENWDNI